MILLQLQPLILEKLDCDSYCWFIYNPFLTFKSIK